MGNNLASGMLHDANKRLEAVWGETVRDWQDDVATRFVNDFWEPLSEIAGRYHRALEELEAALDEAENDG